MKEALAAFQAGELENARKLAEQQLEAQPDFPPLLHLLGLIDCRSGQIEDGADWLRRASDAEPDNIPYRVMLVRALVDSGRPDEALAIAIQPADRSPAGLALWHARAEAADAAGDHDAAAEAWSALAAARPEDWRARSNAGNALAALGRWEEAATALRRALSLNPAEQPIRRNLVSALAEAGHKDQALAEIELLMAAIPDDAQLRLLYSQLLYAVARYSESLVQIDEATRIAVGEGDSPEDGRNLARLAIEEEPLGSTAQTGDQSRAMRMLIRFASLLERTNRFNALRGLIEEAVSAGLGIDQFADLASVIALRDGDPREARRLLLLRDRDLDPVRWHRLMARIADADGNPATAFAEAEAMNRAVGDYDKWRERGAEFRRRTRDLAATITPDWTARLPNFPPGERKSPAFLVGFPRSGTTLLDTFLMGHPDTAVIEEVHMLGAAEIVLGALTELPRRTPAQLEAARRAYFDELDRQVDPGFTGLVVDKLPLNMLGLPFIYCLFPDARLIFAQRHPVDAVLSGFMQSFVMNDAMGCFLDIADAADLYDAAMEVFTRSRDFIPLATQALIYEQLVADPEAALKPLIDFLGLEWRDELLDHQATARARGAIVTASYDQVVQPLSTAPSGRWRRYEKQLAPVLPLLLPWAKLLGYAD